MKVLVTGGGGFLGSAIVRLLRERGWPVRSFARNHYPHLRDWGVEQFEGDLANPLAVSRAVTDCDAVFHVAAKAGVWGRYRDYHSANVIGTSNVVKACLRNRVARLVYTSSPSVVHSGGDIEGADESLPYPTKFEANYPLTKAIAEREVLAANGPELSTVALRPHLIWGPGDPHLIPRLIQRAKRGKLKRIGHDNKLVDTVYVDNAAAAHLLALDRLGPNSPAAGKAYFITNGEPLPLWDFVNRVLHTAGLQPVTKSVPYWLARTAGAILETIFRITWRSSEPPMTRFVARQLATAHWYNITAAKRDLGYSPAISIEEGLRRSEEWLRSLAAR